MSLWCLFGFHRLERVGEGSLGFLVFMRCKKCGAKYETDVQRLHWRRIK